MKENKTLNAELKPTDVSGSINQELIAEPLIRYRDLLRQLNSGIVPQFNPDISNGIEISGEKFMEIAHSPKVNQTKALPLVISCLRELVTLSRPQIKYNSFINWEKEYKTDKKSNPFEKFDCDYNRLLEELEVLNYCRNAILSANRTKSLKDDFIRITDNTNGSKDFRLTQRFYDLSDELEERFENIYFLMLKNKLVNSLVQTTERRSKLNEL